MEKRRNKRQLLKNLLAGINVTREILKHQGDTIFFQYDNDGNWKVNDRPVSAEEYAELLHAAKKSYEIIWEEGRTYASKAIPSVSVEEPFQSACPLNLK